MTPNSDPWVGGEDKNLDDNMYWVGSGIHLPDSSSYWNVGGPNHGGIRDCVYISGNTGKLDTWQCNAADKFICEKY